MWSYGNALRPLSILSHTKGNGNFYPFSKKNQVNCLQKFTPKSKPNITIGWKTIKSSKGSMKNFWKIVILRNKMRVKVKFFKVIRWYNKVNIKDYWYNM